MIIRLSAAVVLLLVTVFVAACQPKEYTQRESEKIARKFVEREATFRFDGITETLLLEGIALEFPDTWGFTYTFTSRHSGYGDRTGQVLLQVLTPHKAKVVVTRYRVTRAIMDESWDMIKQSFLPGS